MNFVHRPIQLDRTANLLLDVEWFAEIGDEIFLRTLQLIREKAPFSRWKKLTIRLSGEVPENSPWSSVDAFTNLEYLCVWYRTHSSVISFLDRTITSRLKVLDLDTWPSSQLEHLLASFAKASTYISTLHAQSIRQTQNAPIPPANVVNLRLPGESQHQFPHIKTYNIGHCTFDRHADIDLRSLTTLIVGRGLAIRPNCRVVLPALRELRLETLEIGDSASIEAPVLDILCFEHNWGTNGTNPGLVPGERFLSWTDGSLLVPGYLLSPTTSITTGWYLWSTTTVVLLAKSPKVTNATLRFAHWTGAQEVLERLAGFRVENNSCPAGNESLCPRLSELMLDFAWRRSDPLGSEEWLLDALKARRNAGISPVMAIYVRWKGEGTYVPLRSY
jgi:hypothetical protein